MSVFVFSVRLMESLTFSAPFEHGEGHRHPMKRGDLVYNWKSKCWRYEGERKRVGWSKEG